MSFREFATQVRSEAQRIGIRLPMAKCNHAIAVACYGRPYSAVIAAERAGSLPALQLPPSHIDEAAKAYGVDEALLAAAFDGVANPITARSGCGSRVTEAVEWLAQQDPNFWSAAGSEWLDALDDEERAAFWELPEEVLETCGTQIGEWLVAEGTVVREGRRERVCDVLASECALLNPEDRKWIRSIGASPLRLYAVAGVVPGERLVMRDLCAPGTPLRHVWERSASNKSVLGSVLGARLVPRDNHLEISAAYPFERAASGRAAGIADLPAKDLSREIRALFVRQLVRPLEPHILTTGGEELLAITDSYSCADWGAVVARLRATRAAHGDWSGFSCDWPDKSGKGFLCTVQRLEDGTVEVFYQSRRAAETGRPWIERMLKAEIAFLDRQELTTSELLELAETIEPGPQPTIPPRAMTDLIQQSLNRIYQDWPDSPLPLFENFTPRQMLATPGGEQRVRALLSTYEAGEAKMAQQEGRARASFEFLWVKMGLDRRPDAPPTDDGNTGQALHPADFRVNVAWVAFLASEQPFCAIEGDFAAFALMDAGSTCVLGRAMAPAGSVVPRKDAEGAFASAREMARGQLPELVLIAGKHRGLESFCAHARDLGIPVKTVTEDEVMPIIGEFRKSMAEFQDKLGL